MPPSREQEEEFENAVRRIARLIWPSAEYSGAAIEDGRERDGVFVTPDLVHLIECTASRSKDKAEHDVAKLAKLAPRMQERHSRPIQTWFITNDEPTAEQREVARRRSVTALSYDQFRSKLIDARTYIMLRQDYPFGSVRDLATDKPTAKLDYISLGMTDSAGRIWTVPELVSSLRDQSSRVVLLGDYGAGKSSTLRELFQNISAAFLKGHSHCFPILLNLRDHHGQGDPTEALERHARRIGFANPSHLVRAWRSGYATLLLDGFDEIATAGWVERIRKLRPLRHKSMELVRTFIRETPARSGIAIAGRAHFFDTEREMLAALGLGSGALRISLSEFTDAQIANYLRRYHVVREVPSWLPARPLLVGYLAARGALADADFSLTPAQGWHELLSRIASREAEIEAGIDAETVRLLIERLASVARGTVDGLGPLMPDEIVAAFTSVCGFAPDDRGAVLLQRLPGLGAQEAEDGSRRFLDNDFAEAARAGDVFRFIEQPFEMPFDVSGWQSSLEELGTQIVAFRCDEVGATAKKLQAALVHAHSVSKGNALMADIVLTLNSLGSGYTDAGTRVYIRDVLVHYLDLNESSPGFEAVEFQDVLFAVMAIPAEVSNAKLPSFVRCYFAYIIGRTRMAEMDSLKFRDCEVDHFEDAAHTTNAILNLDLPLGARVLLTVLKKLYSQRGSGRRESALLRGLDHRAQRLVTDVLALLRQEGFVESAKLRGYTVWLPTRHEKARQRALRMLAEPYSSSDTLLAASARLD